MLWEPKKSAQAHQNLSKSDKISKSKTSRVKYEGPNKNKVRTPKHCALCLKFGGAQSTHNTHECKKWDKVGNLKKEFKSQSKVIREASEKGAA